MGAPPDPNPARLRCPRLPAATAVLRKTIGNFKLLVVLKYAVKTTTSEHFSYFFMWVTIYCRTV
jgi:hypothetical protein